MSKPVVRLSEFKANTAVVQDYESHQCVQDALLMLELVVQGEADVSAGRMVSQRRVFADIKAGLTASDA